MHRLELGSENILLGTELLAVTTSTQRVRRHKMKSKINITSSLAADLQGTRVDQDSETFTDCSFANPNKVIPPTYYYVSMNYLPKWINGTQRARETFSSRNLVTARWSARAAWVVSGPEVLVEVELFSLKIFS